MGLNDFHPFDMASIAGKKRYGTYKKKKNS